MVNKQILENCNNKHRARKGPISCWLARVSFVFIMLALYIYSSSSLADTPLVTPEVTTDGWETANLQDADINPAPIIDLIEALNRGKYINIDSIILARGGKLVLEQYFNGYDRDKLHTIRSATKSIGSLLVGIAVDRGAIKSVKSPLGNYFKKLKTHPDPRARAITMKSLLTMTSGFKCDDHQADAFVCERGMHKSKDWLQYALSLPMAHQPGKHWAYNSASLVLLNPIIQQTSGLKVNDFADKYLFDPLGITNYRWKFSPKGRAWLGGSAAMLPRDMVKIGQLCLEQGLWEGQRIVSQAWLEESTASHVISEYGFPYGYLWWRGGQTIQGREIEVYWAQGNGGQIILVCPDLDLVAVFTGSNFNSVLAFQFAGTLIDYIIPAMLPPETQAPSLPPDSELLQKLPGTYRFGKFPLTITCKSNRVYATFIEKTVPISFQDRTHFTIPNPALGKMLGVVKKDQTGSYTELRINAAFTKMCFTKTY